MYCTTEPQGCQSHLAGTGESPVYRRRATTHDDQREGHAERQQMILKALAWLGARPVHEEAVLPVDHLNSTEHHAGNPEGGQTRQQADGEGKRAEKLGGKDEPRQDRRYTGAGEKLPAWA